MARSLVTTLMEQFHNLTEVEQKVFLDLVDPQPEPAAPAKQTRKKRTTKSAKAESISSAIARTPKADSNEQETDDDPKCGICGNPEEYQDHFQPSPNYHEFEAPKVKKAKSA